MIKNLERKMQSTKSKHKIIVFLFLNFSFTLFALHFALCVAFAQPVLSTDLINNARQYDGKVVVYEGEVIGDVMLRGEYAWINLNDGLNAIGVWLHKGLIKEISKTGGYRLRGDWIEVAGVLHKACPQHGGDLDIHAQSLRKITAGGLIQERLNLCKRNFVFILLGVLCLVLILSILKAK